MAKRKKKKIVVASAVDETSDVASPPVEISETPRIPAVKPKLLKPNCDYCGRKKQLAFLESDEEWELPGHPDRIHRAVCVDCAPDVNARYDCCEHIYSAMRLALAEKKVADSDIEQAIHIAWKAFNVELDSKEMTKMARKLKVKHHWIKGKVAK